MTVKRPKPKFWIPTKIGNLGGCLESEYILDVSRIPRNIWKKVDFRTPTIRILPIRQLRHLRRKSKPEENWGTLARSWDSKMADNCRWTPKIWNTPGEIQIGEFHHEKNSSDRYETYAMQKVYSSHARQCMAIFGNFGPFPNFCLGTNQLPVWILDTDWPKRSPIKLWGRSRQGNMSYTSSALWAYGKISHGRGDVDSSVSEAVVKIWKFGYSGKFFDLWK